MASNPSIETDLDAAARNALRLLGPAPDNWVAPHQGVDHDVTIVGGAQSGVIFGHALVRAGIGSVAIIDAAGGPEQAGIWRTCARMPILRTAKNLPGPELGVPELSFQAWFEARHGQAAYAALARIPRKAWADYLDWYADVVGVRVRYQTRLLRVEPAGDYLRLHLEVNGQRLQQTTRKLVLCTGLLGAGGASVPAEIRAALPQERYAHTSDPLDFSALRGKVVAVVGGAASAFDAAATALEAGAAEVHQLVRRTEIAALPVNRPRSYPGIYDNYDALPDRIRWQLALRARRAGSTPPADAVKRVVALPGFHLHLAAPLRGAALSGGRVEVLYGTDQRLEADFVIAGTGYVVDLDSRPELADFAGRIRRWADAYTPPEAERDAGLSAYPYLGSAYELQEKAAGDAPLLRHIHVFNPAGLVSFGGPIGDVPSIRRGVPAIVARISRDLLLQDLAHHEVRISQDVAPEFEPALYRAVVQD